MYHEHRDAAPLMQKKPGSSHYLCFFEEVGSNKTIKLDVDRFS